MRRLLTTIFALELALLLTSGAHPVRETDDVPGCPMGSCASC